MKPSIQVSHESQNDQQNNQTAEAPLADSGSISASSNDGRKVSRQDIELVRATFSSSNFFISLLSLLSCMLLIPNGAMPFCYCFGDIFVGCFRSRI